MTVQMLTAFILITLFATVLLRLLRLKTSCALQSATIYQTHFCSAFSNLKDYTVINVPGDGHCFFTCVVYYLQHLFNSTITVQDLLVDYLCLHPLTHGNVHYAHFVHNHQQMIYSNDELEAMKDKNNECSEIIRDKYLQQLRTNQ